MTATTFAIPRTGLELRLGKREKRQLRCVGDVQLPAGVAMIAARLWVGHGLKVLASLDQTHHGALLHVSVSHKHRHPSWEEIRAVRDALYPDDVDVMMVLPQAQDYVNIHEHTFHLWSTPSEWGIQ